MIQVKNVVKYYGKNLALDNLNFSIAEGEIVGFLGPNGAGKTTTMNIIAGYFESTSGEVFIDGYNISDKPLKAKKMIGYLPDSPPLYLNMTVLEYLDFVCGLKLVKKIDKNEMISKILRQLDLENVHNRLIRNLSKGYRQRVGFAQALVGNPKVIILDEPISGLDPKQIIEVRDLIKSLAKEHTIILSSHILQEINAVCDRIIIINKGKIVADATPSALSNNLMQGRKIFVRLKGDDVLKFLDGSKKIIYEKQPNCLEENCMDFILQGIGEIDIREEIFRLAVENNFSVLISKPVDMSLEEMFLQVTSEKNQKEGAVND